MSRKNKFGRTDYIPAPIKREIRKRCGFGCVNCGSPFYDYEHWNPPFEELNEEPSVDGITLCCPNCHRKKGKLISMEEYKKNIRSPAAFKQGHITTDWDKGFAPEIILGNVSCSGGTRILEIDNELMIGFHPPETPNSPPRLVARFFGRDGKESFRIIDNECIGNPEAWDIESTGIESGGWRWIIRNGLRNIDLHLELYPPHKIIVRKMYWQYGPLIALASDDGLQLAVHVSEGNYQNIVLLQNMKVRALQENHSFLKINREIQVSNDNHINIQHHLNTSYMEFDGGGIGKFSTDPKEKLIVKPSKFSDTGEALQINQDMRPSVFRFPVFLFVRAEPDTPINNVELATIQQLNNLLPVFDNEKDAQNAQTMLRGDYKLQKLDKNGFIKILKLAALPKRIENITFNPNLAGEGLKTIPFIPISTLLADLESDYTDERIEKMLKNGDAKRV